MKRETWTRYGRLQQGEKSWLSCDEADLASSNEGVEYKDATLTRLFPFLQYFLSSYFSPIFFECSFFSFLNVSLFIPFFSHSFPSVSFTTSFFLLRRTVTYIIFMIYDRILIYDIAINVGTETAVSVHRSGKSLFQRKITLHFSWQPFISSLLTHADVVVTFIEFRTFVTKPNDDECVLVPLLIIVVRPRYLVWLKFNLGTIR